MCGISTSICTEVSCHIFAIILLVLFRYSHWLCKPSTSAPCICDWVSCFYVSEITTLVLSGCGPEQQWYASQFLIRPRAWQPLRSKNFIYSQVPDPTQVFSMFPFLLNILEIGLILIYFALSVGVTFSSGASKSSFLFFLISSCFRTSFNIHSLVLLKVVRKSRRFSFNWS